LFISYLKIKLLFGVDSTIEKKIKVSIEELEFHYGSVAFKYPVVEMNTELQFQVENNEIRPEFEVLKPYFITKQLSI